MAQKRKRKIILIYAKPENAIELCNIESKYVLDYWIYLGKNLILFSEIEKILGDRIQRIETEGILQDVAHSLRKPYINFIGNIAHNASKIAWILSSVSEKNIYLSDLFLMLCYLEVLDQEIKKHIGDICVFCEEPTLIRTIYKNFERRPDFEVHELFPISKTILELIFEKYSVINNKLSFIRTFISRIYYARIFHFLKKSRSNTITNEPVIAIHSWTDHRSFTNDGSFSEPYYGNLGQILENNKTNFLYMIDVLPTFSYPEALKKLSQINFQWVIFEDFIGFSDIIRACYLARRRIHKEKEEIFFFDNEITDLLNNEYSNDRYSYRAEWCALYYFAAQKMSTKFRMKTFIYTFENHIWEKLTIEGIRKNSPHTTIIGFAHSTVNTMNLVYSIAESERKFIPTPDVIVVNGPQAKELLLKSGFEASNIQIIGSLRYGNLTYINKKQKRGGKYEILIVLSINPNKSLEMIHKCSNAFRWTENLSIIFKAHPIANNEDIFIYAGNLPNFFSFSSLPVATLLETADLVIYNDSTVSVEAASMGIPLLHIKSDFTIDMNIFEDVEVIPSVSSPEQILLQSLKIIEGEYPSYLEIQLHVKQIFALVNEKKIVEIFS